MAPGRKKMKTVPGSCKDWRGQTLGFSATWSEASASCRREGNPIVRLGRDALFALGLLAVFFLTPRAAFCQVAPSGDAGGYNLTVGATATGDYLEYGSRKMLGVAAIADLDTKRRIGLEGEAKWLMLHQTANVHATTYLAGPRYHFTFGRFQPYAKGLIGFGQFNYPYNFGTDNDFVIEPGGGLDFRVTKRLRIRVADFEYQIWPQFHYGTLTSYGLSTGIRVRIF
jgi:hypothetical protein